MTEKKTQHFPAFLIGAILGAVVFIIIFGASMISPTNTDWIFAYTGDATQHHLGWVFYRNSPWTFPIGLTQGLTCDGAVSCMYSDSIPLFGVIFKILSPILPHNFQFLGLWGVICFAMNGGFGASLLHRIKPDLIFTSIGSLFYAAFPPSINRITHHNSLGAIWLFILAMILCMDHKKEYKHKFTPMILWSVNCMLAVLIHTYFVPMVYMVMMGYVILTVFRDKKLKKAIAVFVSSVASTLLIMFVIGAFYGQGGYTDGGFGFYASNLNTFFDSRGLSKFLLPLNSFDGQGEGFGYLGLGMIVCTILALIVLFSLIEKKEGSFFSAAKALIKKYNVEILAFAVVFMVSFCWAVSNRITLNGRLLLEIPLPNLVRGCLSIFRASGRFIWVPGVLIITASLGLISKLNKKTAIAAAALCFLIQGMDIRDWCRILHSQYGQPPAYEYALKDEKWDELTKDTKEIIFLPMKDAYGLYMQMYFDFAQMAAEKHMALSSFYLARMDLASVKEYAANEYEKLKTGKGRKDVLYVFFDKEDAVEETDSVKVYDIDGYKVAKVK